MRLAWVILIGVILIMNIANAVGEVFYRTVRLDDPDIFYREAVGQRQRKWRGDLLLKFLSTQTTQLQQKGIR
jgi:hypothetical protein